VGTIKTTKDHESGLITQELEAKSVNAGTIATRREKGLLDGGTRKRGWTKASASVGKEGEADAVERNPGASTSMWGKIYVFNRNIQAGSRNYPVELPTFKKKGTKQNH